MDAAKEYIFSREECSAMKAKKSAEERIALIDEKIAKKKQKIKELQAQRRKILKKANQPESQGEK